FTILYAIIFTALITSLKEVSSSTQKRGGILLLLVIFTGFSTPYISTIILPLFTGFLQFTWWGLLGPLIGGMIFMYALFTQNIFDLKIAGIDLLLLAMAFVLMSITVSSSSVVAFGFNLLTLIIFGILAFFLIHELLLEKQRQHQIAEANQTLSETVDAKENFLRLTSHQLRTPLSSIEGYLNMLLKSPAEEYGYPAEVRTYLEKAHINYQRLNSIVEDISVANKISTDHWNMHTEPNLDPLQIVHEVVEYNQYVAKEHDVSITKNIAPEDISLEGNQSLLFEALDNLVRNSIIYGSTSVEIRVKIKDDALHIKIIDDGIGITEEEMSVVYQRFQRADRAEREYPDGSGIGI
ncbi:MAG: sensor histidine kinase, partial [Candidatus Paceibacteria bacterium]